MRRDLAYWKGRAIDAESVVDDLQMLKDHPEYYAIMCKASAYTFYKVKQIESEVLNEN